MLNVNVHERGALRLLPTIKLFLLAVVELESMFLAHFDVTPKTMFRVDYLSNDVFRKLNLPIKALKLFFNAVFSCRKKWRMKKNKSVGCLCAFHFISVA
jgi:hypothetical protein